MPHLVDAAAVISADSKKKTIEEYVGRVRTGHTGVSIARMKAAQGFEEPGQRPEFDEYTLVLQGTLKVEYEGGVLWVRAGQAVVVSAGEWVRYTAPHPGGADYVAVCAPAFSPDLAHRDK